MRNSFFLNTFFFSKKPSSIFKKKNVLLFSKKNFFYFLKGLPKSFTRPPQTTQTLLWSSKASFREQIFDLYFSVVIFHFFISPITFSIIILKLLKSLFHVFVCVDSSLEDLVWKMKE